MHRIGEVTMEAEGDMSSGTRRAGFYSNNTSQNVENEAMTKLGLCTTMLLLTDC